MLRFIKLREAHLEQVLLWRTSFEVSRYMFTDIQFDMENQIKWFDKVSSSLTDKYWIISFNDKPIGLVSLNEINWTHKRCSWAFYIGEKDHRMIGGMISPYVYFYVFEKLKFQKIMGEVMVENEVVRKLHQLQGCREVGFYRNHIYKNGRYHDVYLYELILKDWEQLKGRYNNCDAHFEE